MSKTYAVMFAPEFRLQAVLRHSPCRADGPAALLEIQGTKPRICELNGAAARQRVERGATPTQAMARCPTLQLLHPNAGQEGTVMEILLQSAEMLSPFLESTQPGVVTVELPHEKEIHAEELRTKLVTPLRSLGLEIGLGVAATPDLALLAARFAEPVRIVAEPGEFLESLPVTALQPDHEIAAVLKSWGIHTIGQFAALPRAQVWERLGPASIRLAELATGGRERPLKLVKPREFFTEQADLEHAVENLEPLLFLLRRFLEQITARLEQAYLVADQLRLVLRFEQGQPHRRVFTIPQPTRDVNILFRMLHTHLENFTSETPIVGLELAARPIRPTAEQFGLLERGLRDPHQFAETLARLTALVGFDQVGAPEIESSHHPDAFHLRAYNPPPAPPAATEELLLGVPWLRFRPPLPARVTLANARPAFFDSARGAAPIEQACGPWRVEGNWWESQRWTREEWDIVTGDGVYRLVRTGGEWFLDGIYA